MGKMKNFALLLALNLHVRHGLLTHRSEIAVAGQRLLVKEAVSLWLKRKP